MSAAPRTAPALDRVLICLADVLHTDTHDIETAKPLLALGLDSLAALRLRRLLHEHTGADLPISRFLGPVTALDLAAAVGEQEAAPSTDAHPVEACPITPDDDGAAPFPLTPVQESYWVGRDPSFALGGVATWYHTEHARRLTPGSTPGSEIALLAAAWRRLVVAHPMLRAVVDPDGRQRVLPVADTAARWEPTVDDLRPVAPDARPDALTAIRAHHDHRCLDPARWPLFDLHVVVTADDRLHVLLGLDVLVTDLASHRLVMRQWGELMAEPATALPTPPRSFAALLRDRAEDPGYRRQHRIDADWWAHRVPDLPPGPALPRNRPDAELHGHRFVRHTTELEPARWSALRAGCARHGLSSTAALMATFALTLHRFGAQQPFTLITTLFDRPAVPGVEHVVGDFTSTCPVAVPAPDVAAWSGFAGWAHTVNARFWEDLEHRAVTGVEVLRGRRSTGSRTGPEFPVVFTSGIGLPGGADGPAPDAWLGELVAGVSQTPQVLIDHIVTDQGGRLRVTWDVVDGAFPTGWADGAVAAHGQLLHRLATEPALWDDPTLGWDPTFQPVQPLTARPFRDAAPTLDGPLVAAAEAVPGAAAVLTATGGPVTAGALEARARVTAETLAGAGVGPGDLVAVACPKGPAQIAAILGVARSGAGYVPVEPDWPAPRVASVCAQAQIRHALVTDDAATAWPAEVAVHPLTRDGVIAGSSAGRPAAAAPDELAYVIFTSGSTGQPKGVAIEHRQARTTIDDLVERFRFTPADRVLALSAAGFDLSVFDVFGLLGVGGAMVLPDPDRLRDPQHWLDLCAQHGVTVWNTAPALMEMLVEHAEVDPSAARRALASLRLVMLSGDWIPVPLPDRIRALAPQAEVVSLGGATEASIWSICHPISAVDPSWPSIPYGRALSGQSFWALDGAGRPQPVGEPGELYIGGDGVARGYVGDPQQTAERFAVHPVLGERLYRTGDLGRWRPDGTLQFLGRVDRQVKVRGHRIELGDVEAALGQVPGVRLALAAALPGPDGRPRLVAYAVPAGGGNRIGPSEQELLSALRDRLPSHLLPTRVAVLDALPLTANGKVDHAALPNPFATRRRRDGPRTGHPAHPATEPSAAAVTLPASGHANVPTPRMSRSGPPGWIADALDAAHGEGLDVGLTVLPRSADPEELEAAARWLRRVRTLCADRDLPMRHRLDGPGLVTVHTEGAAHPAGLSHRPSGPEQPPSPVMPSPVSQPDVDDRALTVAISEVFAELLGATPEPTTTFFEAGATSLTLVIAARALAQRLPVPVEVVDLFDAPTVARLAAALATRRPSMPTGATAPALPEPSAAQPADRAARRRAAREALAGDGR